VAAVFKYLNLADPTKSLGLPEGSVQAVIALSLILIFMIMSLVLYTQVNTNAIGVEYKYTGINQTQLDAIPSGEITAIQRITVTDQKGVNNSEVLFNVTRRVIPKTSTSEDIAKQIITTVSTLVVAVAGFYFGSKAVAAAKSESPSMIDPVIRSISPDAFKREEEFEFKITGKNFDVPKEVKLINGLSKIACTEITSNDTLIKCMLKIPGDLQQYPDGAWTVVVTNSDGCEDRLEGAFKI
jgi:hypothetical protein